MCGITGMEERLHKVKTDFHDNKKPPLTYNGENYVATFSQLFFYLIPFILAGNEDVHKILDEFEFRPDRTTD